MNVLGAAEGAGAGVVVVVEVLLMLLVVPNRLGVEVEEDEVLELEGFPAIKENAGFGAAVESATLCPKVKEGFGASEVDVSLFSAGLPNVYGGGGGCSVGALGLPKEKPPVLAGAESASLLAAPKRKVG